MSDIRNRLYDKKRRDTHIHFRLSLEERCVLKKMMKEDEWLNKSGFVKWKIFGDSVDSKYDRMLKSSKEDDIKITLPEIVQEFDRNIAYLDYRFTEELEKIQKKAGIEDENLIREILVLKDWIMTLNKKNETLSRNIHSLCSFINIDVQKQKYGKIEAMPDHILQRMVADWDNSDPEALQEISRRLDRDREKRREKIRKEREKKKTQTDK